jgi:hemolysin activation/secretion protein
MTFEKISTYRIFLSIAALVIALTNQNFAFAQVDAGALQQNLEKQFPAPSPLALPEPQKPSSGRIREDKGGSAARITVSGFTLEGVNLIPESDVQEALKPWVGKTIGYDELQRTCDAVIALYLKYGYTVQAVLPPQKIVNGVVKILVTESKLSSVVVNTPQGDTRFGVERAKVYVTNTNPIGAPISLDAIDRAMAVLNETPGVVVDSQLKPGEKNGDTAIEMNLTQPDLVSGRVELNNYGSRTTGANQGVVSLNLINPSGIGDQASVNGIYSEGSQYIQGLYSLPVSTDGLRFGVSGTYLEYKNVSNYVSPNGGSGDAWTTGLSAAYPLIRSQATNMNVTANYDIKSYMNKNLISNAVISSYNINDFTIGLSGNHYDSIGYGGVSNGSVSVVFGQLGISPTSSAGYGQYTPPNFTKLVFSGSRNQQLVDGGATSFYAAVSGQMASVNLNSAEQFYLGGPYGVRAYPVAQSGGSQGGIATIEIRQQLPKSVVLGAFFDAGVVQQYKNMYAGWQGLTNANNTYSLMGAGLSLKWNYVGWNLGAMVAWKVGVNPLYNQYGQAVNTDGTTTQPRGWVTGSYEF